MTRAALALLCLALPAHAGDTAPGAHLWPAEPRYEATVIEVSTLGPLFRRCDLDPCGDWYQRPDPAPVPLPSSGLIMLAALGLLWRMRWAK